MSGNEQKAKRREVTKREAAALELLWRYRFLSLGLLAQLLAVPPTTSLRTRVEKLIAAGYVGRRYDKSFRLQGKPAAFYLTPSGFRVLQQQSDTDTAGLPKNRYRDKTLGQDFVDHCLLVTQTALRLKAASPALQLFTTADMQHYDYFPGLLPDAFLSLSRGTDTPRRFFLDVFTAGTPGYVHQQRLRRYREHIESGGWAVFDESPPCLLIVCTTPAQQKRLQPLLESELAHTGLPAYSSNLVLLASVEQEPAVWSPLDELTSCYKLHQLPASK